MAKKKGKGRNKRQMTFADADIDQKKFLRLYSKLCELDDSPMCVHLQQAMADNIEKMQYLTKFIICPPPKLNDDVDDVGPVVSLEPVIKALRETFYEYITELCVWDLEMGHRCVAALAMFLERRKFKIGRLELMDCDVQGYSMERLSQSFSTSVLTHLNFDYNEFGDEGCRLLCNGCKENKTIISLSLCYCKLTSQSGSYLADVINTTCVCELYLDGNKLECDGVTSLLISISDAAEEDNERVAEEKRLKELMIAEGALQATDRELNTQMSTIEVSGNESSTKTGEKKAKKKKKKKGGKKKPDPPGVGPYIDVLHLSDNGIDLHNDGKYDVLLPSISVLQRLIAHSHRLREMDLSRNSLSETSCRDILFALEQRKEFNIPKMKMMITTDISMATFNQIQALSGGLSKKKKKGKKKKKKKK